MERVNTRWLTWQGKFALTDRLFFRFYNWLSNGLFFGFYNRLIDRLFFRLSCWHRWFYRLDSLNKYFALKFIFTLREIVEKPNRFKIRYFWKRLNNLKIVLFLIKWSIFHPSFIEILHNRFSNIISDGLNDFFLIIFSRYYFEKTNNFLDFQDSICIQRTD